MIRFQIILLLLFLHVPIFAIGEGYNFYAYAGGDPINRWDPSGLDWQWVNGKWEKINGTKWVKPPMPGIHPEHLGGKEIYNILDHIHVNNALSGMSNRGEPLTSYRLTQAVAAQRDLWNALPGSTQVTRINYAFGAWDRTMIQLEPHSGEGYLQGKIVDNLTSESFATRLLGKVQRIGYNTLNTSRLFTFKGSDQRLGAYHAGAISAERNQELKVDEYISAGIDVALLLTTGGAGNVAATGTSRLLVWTGRSINAGFAGYSGAHAYDAARQGNYTEAGYHAAFAFLGGAGAVRSNLASVGSNGPASGASRLQGVRNSYNSALDSLRTRGRLLLENGVGKDRVARYLHAQRRQIGLDHKHMTPLWSRLKIYYRNRAPAWFPKVRLNGRWMSPKGYDHIYGPSFRWLRQSGKSLDDIIESSTRSSAEVNRALGVRPGG